MTDKILIWNMLCDLKKKELCKFERAKLIRQYLEQKCISARELARRLAVPWPTLNDWLLYDRLSEERYQEMRKNGMSETMIYRSLKKNNRPIEEISQGTGLNYHLSHILDDLKKVVRNIKPNEITRESHDLAFQAYDTINRIRMKIENRNGGS